MARVPPGFRSIVPTLPNTAYQTFRAAWSVDTHFRDATCQEYECEGYLHGWSTTIDTSDDLGKRRYHFVTHDTTRTYTERKISDTLYIFDYPPGQTCFAPPNRQGFRHKVALERDPRYLVAGGDWRGLTSPWRTHSRAEFWVEEFQENLDGIRTRIDRG